MSNRSDNFDRTDGTIGGTTPSDGGSTWTSGGDAQIKSNQLGSVTSGAARNWAKLEASASNGTAQVTAKVLAAGTGMGLLVRMADATNYIGAYIYSGKLELYKRVAGAFTALGSTYTGTISVNDVITLDVTSGSALTVKQNGTTRITATDSTGSTNTGVGFDWFQGDPSLRVDDFSWTDAAAATTSIPAIRAFPRAVLNF